MLLTGDYSVRRLDDPKQKEQTSMDVTPCKKEESDEATINGYAESVR